MRLEPWLILLWELRQTVSERRLVYGVTSTYLRHIAIGLHVRVVHHRGVELLSRDCELRSGGVLISV